METSTLMESTMRSVESTGKPVRLPDARRGRTLAGESHIDVRHAREL